MLFYKEQMKLDAEKNKRAPADKQGRYACFCVFHTRQQEE